ncbi:hypothetical protein SCLCIDRAFT_1207542 [Scleroderma citrinum Foug A]|uniref:Uncharacterized protein n=1 Tax=Scleroderma citrinum Foug A TaxID=1036808 RepID=A0A0C3EQZ8_9AGAM|nr:hypothetical protein SCLCIDRAFT_1207542 [Scleroderma citrinum Foug A]
MQLRQPIENSRRPLQADWLVRPALRPRVDHRNDASGGTRRTCVCRKSVQGVSHVSGVELSQASASHRRLLGIVQSGD